MRVEVSFHDATVRQYVEDVVTVVYNNSVAVVYQKGGVKFVYPLINLHRIKEMPSEDQLREKA